MKTNLYRKNLNVIDWYQIFKIENLMIETFFGNNFSFIRTTFDL